VSDEEEWLDEAAGPVVRPYAMTSGRTRPSSGDFDLIAIIVANRTITAGDTGMAPEHTSIVRLCQRPISVAEIASHVDLPIGIVRVLLGDLLDRDLIRVHLPGPTTLPTERLYKEVIDGLRAL
jgi:Protein of unknown function (DUF742)